MDFTEIDETYNLYERRYNLTKMAAESGISDRDFKNLSPKERFLLLAYKLKDNNKINLASFFFGKLFEISGEIEALINKIDCLIELGEYEESQRFNNFGWELYLEDILVNPSDVEKKLSYQKAIISFYTEKYHYAESICEESIIKFRDKEFYFLLCADFIALSNYNGAKKFFEKYGDKFGNQIDFLLEVFIHLLNINLLDKALDFINFMYGISDNQKSGIINYVNNYYSLNKNKVVLKSFFEKEVNFINNVKH
ncbi:MAG: hypothetical protein A2Z98_11415 [Spirochaetes bacterium GWB1_27_13]|nr:MAG: hypothetical protein A2Z98_11415 [Spirochaetes bacterium GWB1_27_13]